MIILAIDTTSDHSSLALAQLPTKPAPDQTRSEPGNHEAANRQAATSPCGAGSQPAADSQSASPANPQPVLLETFAFQSPEGHSQTLFPHIQSLLDRHHLTWQDLGGIAVTSGPGSFTGVRVGLTAAKGLAEATNTKVVAVSNLQALAWFGTAPLRAPIIDARRGDIFGAVYDAALELVQPETVQPLEAFLATLPPGTEQITGPHDLAQAVARIAAPIFAAGHAQDPAEIDANYVRHSDAELKWKER